VDFTNVNVTLACCHASAVTIGSVYNLKYVPGPDLDCAPPRAGQKQSSRAEERIETEGFLALHTWKAQAGPSQLETLLRLAAGDRRTRRGA
jgi:hypothetical protein